MDIPLNATVYCGEENVGTTRILILDPVQKRVTHVVVKERGLIDHEYLVPLEKVAETTADAVTLACSHDELRHFDRFAETYFVDIESPDYLSFDTGLMAWPYVTGEPAYAVDKEEHIPPGELTIRRGARVVAKDGLAGHVDEFVVAPETGNITHLVVRERRGLETDDITVPVANIAHFDGNEVQLNLTRHDLDGLVRVLLRRYHHARVKRPT